MQVNVCAQMSQVWSANMKKAHSKPVCNIQQNELQANRITHKSRNKIAGYKWSTAAAR